MAAVVCAGCSAFDPHFGALQPEGQDDDAEAADDRVVFERDIRPLMDRAADDPEGPGCARCHYSTAPLHVGFDLGGLDLATLGALRAGGATSGTDIVVPGDPGGSVLVQKLRGTHSFGARMPRNAPRYWNDEETGLVEQWILEGAEGADDE
jgi:hypothetical protein